MLFKCKLIFLPVRLFFRSGADIHPETLGLLRSNDNSPSSHSTRTASHSALFGVVDHLMRLFLTLHFLIICLRLLEIIYSLNCIFFNRLFLASLIKSVRPVRLNGWSLVKIRTAILLDFIGEYLKIIDD